MASVGGLIMVIKKNLKTIAWAFLCERILLSDADKVFDYFLRDMYFGTAEF